MTVTLPAEFQPLLAAHRAAPHDLPTLNALADCLADAGLSVAGALAMYERDELPLAALARLAESHARTDGHRSMLRGMRQWRVEAGLVAERLADEEIKGLYGGGWTRLHPEWRDAKAFYRDYAQAMLRGKKRPLARIDVKERVRAEIVAVTKTLKADVRLRLALMGLL